MKFNKSFHIAREESFEIETPEVSVMTISSEVTIMESMDGKTHIKIFADSKKAAQLADLVEIVESNGKLTIRIDKKNWGWNVSLPLDMKDRNFWGLSFGGLHGLSIELALPKASNLKIKTVSGDIEVNQTLSSLEIASVSGDITVVRNPDGGCTIKTVSGDISTHTFSACQYSLKSVSGDIRVHVAPNLEVDVDGNSISGDLSSEISLDANGESPISNAKVVTISTSTISGNFTLARN